jgi:hypothetical protein
MTTEFVSATRDVAILFVATVRAVLVAVALLWSDDATPVSASEFALRTITQLAVEFIGSVSTIVVVVAPPSARNASTVVALEIRFVASCVLTIRRFITQVTISAVVVAVTLPSFRNAATGIAFEIILRAWRISAVAGFVRSVSAIVVTIAFPHVRNATPVVAFELVPGTQVYRAIFFVGTISAILDSIATMR